jgi:hypothetical protein
MRCRRFENEEGPFIFIFLFLINRIGFVILSELAVFNKCYQIKKIALTYQF